MVCRLIRKSTMAILVSAGMLVAVSCQSTAPLKDKAPGEHVKTGSFELNDQFNKPRTVKFPPEKITVLMFANRKSARQGEKWGTVLWERYEYAIAMEGIGVGTSVPNWEQAVIRFLIRQATEVPIMLDWDGRIAKRYGFDKEALNVIVINKKGRIVLKLVGKATGENQKKVFGVLDGLLKK